MLNTGIDWEHWSNDADERVAEAAQSLVDMMMTMDLAEPNRIAAHQHQPLQFSEAVNPAASRIHVLPPISSPDSSRASTPLPPPSASRSSKLPSKLVNLQFHCCGLRSKALAAAAAGSPNASGTNRPTRSSSSLIIICHHLQNAPSMSSSIVAINEVNNVPPSLQVSSDLLRTPTTENGAASVSAFVSLLADLHVCPTHNTKRYML